MQLPYSLFSGAAALAVLALATVMQPEAATAEERNPVAIEEWPVPFEGHPRDPFAVSGDEIWFVGQQGNYLARLTPSRGAFTRYALPDSSGPHNLLVGDNGIVWYAGNLAGYIGRFDPERGDLHKVLMPDPAARDPHTMVFDADQSHIWFTVQNGNFVGRLTIEGKQVDLIPVPTEGARPYGIRMAPDGTPWIALVGTNKLASVDPKTLRLTEYEIPAAEARPRRLEVTPDGRVWYADYARGRLGLYDPAKRQFRDWEMPSGSGSYPYGMALDASGRVWLVETGAQPNLFVGFDTASERFVSITPIPSGGSAVRHMDYHRPTGTVWFGTDEETIGRAAVEPGS